MNKWIKASKTQWFLDNGNEWIGISKRSGYYWLWVTNKETSETTPAVSETEATLHRKLSTAKEEGYKISGQVVIKATRVNTGVYDVEYKNRSFYVERMSAIMQDTGYENDNSWMINEIEGYVTSYWGHYATKKEALKTIQTVVDKELRMK